MSNLKLPQDLDAERGTICAALLDPDCLAIARDSMAPDGSDFYSRHHGTIWETIALQARLGNAVDTASISTRLKESGNSNAIDTLLEITNSLPMFGAIEKYCKRVKNRAAMRKSVMEMQKLISEACSNPEDEDAYLDKLESGLGAATEGRFEVGKMLTIGECVEAAAFAAEARSMEGGGLEGYATGLVDLDNKTSGMGRGKLITIGGRPGMGKSALGFTMATGIAKLGLHVVVFSFEMPAQELGDRNLSAESMVPAQDLQGGNLNEQDWRDIARARAAANALPMTVSDNDHVTVELIARESRRAKRKHGQLGAILIDYLQLIKSSPGFAPGNCTRDREIGHQTSALKSLAKELDCPVILLAQLNRKSVERPNQRPQLSDLRESGAIEQDSDIVLFVYRDAVPNPDTKEPDVMEVIVDKHRAGCRGTVKLHWDGQHIQVLNRAHHQPWEADHAVN